MMAALTIVAGVVIGVLVGITGTSGAFLIPMLVYCFGMGQLRAQGTALLIAASPVWIIPLVPYWRANHVDWKVGLQIAVGLGVGSYFGARGAQILPETVVRRIFAVVLFAVALRMFFRQ
jgi:uncharacterized membrane protein YfcA